MDKLNEYCLHHINTFLEPRDWLQVSQVCRLWKETTKRNWRTIFGINWISACKMIGTCHENQTEVISSTDAAKIVLNAAPFVKILIAQSPNDQTHEHVLFGNYCYTVKNFKIETILELLAKRATEMVEIHFDEPPSAALVKQLLNKNKITKISFDDDDSRWYQQIPTHGFEELNLTFEMVTEDLLSFEGHFPNLTRLKLKMVNTSDDPRDDMLSKIFPYVPGLKYLDLTVIGGTFSYTLLSDIAELSELEEFSLQLLSFDFKSAELFLNQLPKCCPKIRVLKIMGCINKEVEVIENMLTLPQLEHYQFLVKDGFAHVTLPETTRLRELDVVVYNADPILTGFFRAVKKITSLEKLQVQFVNKPKTIVLLRLVCGVIKAAATLEKEVLLTHFVNEDNPKKLKITKSNNQNVSEVIEEERKVLVLTIEMKNEKKIFDGVKQFVQEKLQHYQVVELRNKK